MLLYKEKCLFDVQNVQFHIFVVAAEIMVTKNNVPQRAFVQNVLFTLGYFDKYQFALLALLAFTNIDFSLNIFHAALFLFSFVHQAQAKMYLEIVQNLHMETWKCLIPKTTWSVVTGPFCFCLKWMDFPLVLGEKNRLMTLSPLYETEFFLRWTELIVLTASRGKHFRLKGHKWILWINGSAFCIWKVNCLQSYNICVFCFLFTNVIFDK